MAGLPLETNVKPMSNCPARRPMRVRLTKQERPMNLASSIKNHARASALLAMSSGWLACQAHVRPVTVAPAPVAAAKPADAVADPQTSKLHPPAAANSGVFGGHDGSTTWFLCRSHKAEIDASGHHVSAYCPGKTGAGSMIEITCASSTGHVVAEPGGFALYCSEDTSSKPPQPLPSSREKSTP